MSIHSTKTFLKFTYGFKKLIWPYVYTQGLCVHVVEKFFTSPPIAYSTVGSGLALAETRCPV